MAGEEISSDDQVVRMGIQLKSILTCPDCGYQKEETMPADSCQFFYTCTNFGTVLRALAGDCCVYCSYGSVVSPSKQRSSVHWKQST